MISFALKNILRSAMVLGLLAQSSVGYADFTTCSQNFYQQGEPIYTDSDTSQKLKNEAYPLCFHGFAVMYSGESRTPLWSAEYLTKERIYQADDMPREDVFHEEGRVASKDRASLEDYSGSGYDRGHLAPNSDMANAQQQYDSFSLANIVPQSPYLNRHTWKQIESATRYLTKVYGEAYVITGVVFTDRPKKIDNSVSVPSHLFKAIYLPQVNKAGVYYAPNDESGRIEVLSLQQFAQQSGIELMPRLESYVASESANLPMPFEAFGRLSDETEKTQAERQDETIGDKVTEGSKAGFSLAWVVDWVSELLSWIRQHLQQ